MSLSFKLIQKFIKVKVMSLTFKMIGVRLDCVYIQQNIYIICAQRYCNLFLNDLDFPR